MKSNRFRFAERAHLLQLEPLSKAVSIVAVPTPKPDALRAHVQVLLADQALLLSGCAHGPLKPGELLLGQALGDFADLVPQF